MDRSWMQLGNRVLPEYVNGVNDFLKFVINHMDNGNTIRCPCYKCNNCCWLTPDQVRDHLVIHGIVKVYNPWVYHGEMAAAASESECNNDDSNDVVDDDIDIVGDGTWDMLHELNNESLFNDWASSSTSNNESLFTDATQPLYSGCKASKFSFIVKLLHLKIINKQTNKSFTMLLELLNTIHPSDAQFLSNYYKAKKFAGDEIDCFVTYVCITFRYIHTLKGYIFNKVRPKGSIAEGYIDNECLTFVSMYFHDMETKFTKPNRNCNADHGQSPSELSIFQHKAHGLGAAINIDLNMFDWAQIRWEHKEGLERDNVKDIEVKQQLKFPRWFLKWLIQLELDGCNISAHDLKSIARGPDKSVVQYSDYMINGHRFRTLQLDVHKRNQNSGIVIKGEHNEVETNFFGVLRKVIELTYLSHKKVSMFKCDWWDMGPRNRIHVDGFSFWSVMMAPNQHGKMVVRGEKIPIRVSPRKAHQPPAVAMNMEKLPVLPTLALPRKKVPLKLFEHSNAQHQDLLSAEMGNHTMQQAPNDGKNINSTGESCILLSMGIYCYIYTNGQKGYALVDLSTMTSRNDNVDVAQPTEANIKGDQLKTNNGRAPNKAQSKRGKTQGLVATQRKLVKEKMAVTCPKHVMRFVGQYTKEITSEMGVVVRSHCPVDVRGWEEIDLDIKHVMIQRIKEISLKNKHSQEAPRTLYCGVCFLGATMNDYMPLALPTGSRCGDGNQ
ncbi:hypothetical protein FEM48_Zijuj09G0230800 [Ziziphus jujuba var. spinosa]|uniref:Transposase-associated domain-containing protein n=1 Tax=Ziziphus jujuba var. spinosa TaxID=714518 RepID=A0A978UVU7_ZIZJJ|nr:hypothetical protein FEM48_Zijuj09G0230800 [Ziziphus jujuba var. spinosa]